MGKRATAFLAIVLLLAGCGPGADLTELASDPMAQLELDGTSIDHRNEQDSGGSLMSKPTRASVTTAYAIGEERDPDAVREAAVEAANAAGWTVEERADRPLVTGTKTLRSGQAELSISFGSDFIDGELVVDRSELIVILQHAWRR